MAEKKDPIKKVSTAKEPKDTSNKIPTKNEWVVITDRSTDERKDVTEALQLRGGVILQRTVQWEEATGVTGLKLVSNNGKNNEDVYQRNNSVQVFTTKVNTNQTFIPGAQLHKVKDSYVIY